MMTVVVWSVVVTSGSGSVHKGGDSGSCYNGGGEVMH